MGRTTEAQYSRRLGDDDIGISNLTAIPMA